jgi:hypothetical protein
MFFIQSSSKIQLMQQRRFGIQILFCLFTGLFSCEPPIVFSEPQPPGAGKLEQFPESIRGQYVCLSDTSLFIVTSDLIFQEKTYMMELSKNEIAATPEFLLSGDSLFFTDDIADDFALVEPLNDTLYRATWVARDTFFGIGPDGVLKKFRGHLILNTKLDDEKWGVWILDRDRYGVITLAETALPEDLDALKAITPVEDITVEGGRTQYRIAPSRSAFRKLLRKETTIFEHCETFEPLGTDTSPK